MNANFKYYTPSQRSDNSGESLPEFDTPDLSKYQPLAHPNGRVIYILRREPDFIKMLVRCGYVRIGGER